jgi:F-type H+-transporting ATPase subunit b
MEQLINPTQILIQIISFLILFFVLKIFVWKKIMSFLEQRKEKIKTEFENIENLKKEVSSIKETYEKNISNIEEISFQKIQEGINEGNKIADDIKNKASIEAQKIIDKAKEDIKFEIIKAKEDIKNQIIDLTILSTKELLEKEIDENEDKKIIEKFLEEIKENE